MRTGLRRALRRLVGDAPPASYSTRIASLPCETAPRGRVLIAYILEPFLRPPGEPVSSAHTHDMESVLMARGWLAKGFAVDVIDYRNAPFAPTVAYDYFVSARTHLADIAPRLGGSRKVAHFDTSHFAVNNRAAYQRLVELQERRGASLPASIRLIESNLAVEGMDLGVVLGNAVTAGTYAYGGKPLYELCVPAVSMAHSSLEKRFDDCRRRFVWLGSGGLVHKGLDLVLEAFAAMPEMHLTVCGPLDREPEFCRFYARELSLPNVSVRGWVDVGGASFRELAASSVALVYPSCAEGQAGAVVNAMAAGLIPIVSRESGVDVDGFGELLPRSDVATIIEAVQTLAASPEPELRRRTAATLEAARTRHSHDAYVARYGQILDAILSR